MFTNIALSLIMDISMALITGVILSADEPKAFCGNCNDDNHKYSAGIYI